MDRANDHTTTRTPLKGFQASLHSEHNPKPCLQYHKHFGASTALAKFEQNFQATDCLPDCSIDWLPNWLSVSLSSRCLAEGNRFFLTLNF